MPLAPAPVARVQMLIRKPVAEVFEAFVDPAITTKFWFTKSSGQLAAGQTVRWDWEMYGVGTQVVVKALEPNRRILIEWSDEAPNEVEWLFTPRPDGTTFVTITNAGFQGSPQEVASQAIDAMGGFSLLIAEAKAWLEHGLRLNLAPDQNPDALQPGWRPG